MDVQTQLEQLGFTRGESAVYIALLQTGASGVGAIINKSGVSNSKVYAILERLGKKGFVSLIVKNGRKVFEAKPPKRIEQFLQIKEQEILAQKEQAKDIIAQLQTLQTTTSTQSAQILQGIEGIKTFCELALDSMEKGDTFRILGAPSKASEILGGYFHEWHKRRVVKGIKCDVLYNADSKKWAERRSKSALTKIRFLPETIVSPVMIDITKNYVATIIFTGNPICIVVKNDEVAKSYINYFKMLWKQSD